MYFVDNKEITDPRINIALETYLVEHRLVDEPILLFYINEPSIIIGRNQNTIEEVNQQYIEENNIHVVRRMSGGGAVYHDLGNCSFCFIKDADGSFRDFGKFTQPVIDALHQMGVENAELKGRNDLLIGDKKFSGNAMYEKNGRMTAHGTLLFDTDLDEVTKALKPRKEKIESKGIKSIRSRVTNIKPYVAPEYQSLTTQEFRDKLLLKIFNVDNCSQVKEYVLTEEDWEQVYKIRDERFGNWDWNYGKSPQFTLEQSYKFPFGLVEFKLNVENAKIQDIRIFGDFFGLGDISDVENALKGIPFEINAVENVFTNLNIQKYFGQITAKELSTLLVLGAQALK